MNIKKFLQSKYEHFSKAKPNISISDIDLFKQYKYIGPFHGSEGNSNILGPINIIIIGTSQFFDNAVQSNEVNFATKKNHRYILFVSDDLSTIPAESIIKNIKSNSDIIRFKNDKLIYAMDVANLRNIQDIEKNIKVINEKLLEDPF